MKILFIIILLYILFIGDCKIRYTNAKYKRTLEYNGLLWVYLYWDLHKQYPKKEEDNFPKKFFKYTKEKL